MILFKIKIEHLVDTVQAVYKMAKVMLQNKQSN